jgi:phage antirepressor YoqD-like protein
MGEISTATKPTQVYIFDASHKRDTYVVVAQLSPEFTARIVDRWQELEAKHAQPAIPQTYAEALQLAADQARQIEQQTKQIEAAKPAVEFHERVADTTDAHTLDETAKLLRCGPRKLRAWMKVNQIMRLDGLPYQEHITRGYFRVIEKAIPIGGAYKLHAQTYCTGKGLQWLQRRIDHNLMGQEI